VCKKKKISAKKGLHEDISLSFSHKTRKIPVLCKTWRAHIEYKKCTRETFIRISFDILKWFFWWQKRMHPRSNFPFKDRLFTRSNMKQDPLLQRLDWFFTS
jgi:hypothetical protein